MDYPDLTMLLAETATVGFERKRDYVSLLRCLVRLHGREKVSRLLNKDEQWLKDLCFPKPSERIDRSFEKCTCPVCNGPVASPLALFDIDDNRTKIIRSNCIHCMKPLSFTVKKEEAIIVAVDGPITQPIDSLCKEHMKCWSNRPLGVRFTTEVYFRWSRQYYYTDSTPVEVRVGIAVMGSMNYPKLVGCCPFDTNYHDNWAGASGEGAADALRKLDIEITRLSEGLV